MEEETKKSSEAQEESKSETLFSKVIPKMNKSGTSQVGSHLVETKTFEGHKFIQVTQEKYAFGNIPAKKSWVTINPEDDELKKAISEAYKH